MTVSNTIVRVRYNGTGAQTIFPYTYKIFVTTDLRVIITDANGLDTLQTLDVHYTVSGAGSEAGGNVTFVIAPAATSFVTIIRELPLTQGTDYVENDPFPANADETAADRVVMLCQQVKEYVARALLLKEGNALRNLLLPTPVANYLLGWDAAGTGMINFPTTPISVPTIDYLGNYGNSLAAAVTAIGSAPKLLQINQPTSVTADLTIPTTLTLWPTPGGIITVSAGKTLTINGPLQAGPYQIFAGTGTIVLGSLNYIQYGEWTGSSGINIITAVSIQNQQYIAAAAGGTVDVITASVTPTPAALVNNLKVSIEAAGANTSTAPTFNLNGLGAKTIVKGSNQALVAGDISGANARIDLIYDLSLTKWVLINPAYAVSVAATAVAKYALLQNRRAQGVGGGATTAGSWLIVPLNTEQEDSDSIVDSSALPAFSLSAGTYRIEAIVPLFQASTYQTRLYNVTDTATAIIGESGNITSSGYLGPTSHLDGIITIAGTKQFRLEYYVGAAVATGHGSPANFGVEVYAQLRITKLP